MEVSGSRLCGWAGLLGACLVGIGEAMIQYTPGGDLTAYDYLADIPISRQSIGHWIAVLSAPLYIPGYWFLSRQFPQDRKLATMGFALMAYAFIIGAVWMGGRIDLALVSHGIEAGENWADLREHIAGFNEPLVNVLRVSLLLWSGFWVWAVAKGRSTLPRWMAIPNPIAILATIFALYFIAPSIGGLILPAAMNVTHVIIFGVVLGLSRPQSI